MADFFRGHIVIGGMCTPEGARRLFRAFEDDRDSGAVEQASGSVDVPDDWMDDAQRGIRGRRDVLPGPGTLVRPVVRGILRDRA